MQKNKAESWKLLSICSGIGGFELGLLHAEIDVKIIPTYFIDIDPFCVNLLNLRFPPAFRAENKAYVKDVRDYKIKPGDYDVICGGIPCQPYSDAGNKNGHDDPRDLWKDALRLIDEGKPKLFMLENTTGLLTGETQFMRNMADQLIERGYVIDFGIISAASQGGCHVRNRVFAVIYQLEHFAEHIENYKRNLLVDGFLRTDDKIPFNAFIDSTGVYHTRKWTITDKHSSYIPTMTYRNGISPGVRSWKEGQQKMLSHVILANAPEGHRLSEPFVERFMGYPIGWTDFKEKGDALKMARNCPTLLNSLSMQYLTAHCEKGSKAEEATAVRRLSALGNAIVPACAKYAWERVMFTPPRIRTLPSVTKQMTLFI